LNKLRIYCSFHQQDWDKFLATAEFAYNNNQSQTTKMSPFFANYGYHPTTPAILNLPTSVEESQKLSQQIQDITKLVQQNIEVAQKYQKTQADKHRRDIQLQKDQLVLLSTTNFTPSNSKSQSPKFQPRYIGPFRISEIISPTSYRLDLPEYLKIHNVFYISLLKPYQENNEQKFPNRHQKPSPPIIIDGTEE